MHTPKIDAVKTTQTGLVALLIQKYMVPIGTAKTAKRKSVMIALVKYVVINLVAITCLTFIISFQLKSLIMIGKMPTVSLI